MIQRHSDDGYEITLVTSLEEVERLREIWKKMELNPYQNMDYYLLNIKLENMVVRPYIIILSENGIVRALLAGRLIRSGFKISLGYKVFFEPKVRCLLIAYGGVLGDDSYSICKALISEVNNVLWKGEADVAILGNLQLNSCMYKLATTLPEFLSRNYFPERTFNWRLSLAGSYTDYLCTLSKNTRDNLRKFANRIGRRYGDRLSLRCYRRREDLNIIMEDTEKIASKAWQRAVGVGFFNDDATGRRYEFALSREWLRAYLIYIDGVPVAFRHGLQYGNTYYAEITGFDPNYHDDRVGTFLLTKVIEHLCDQGGIKVIDFGVGADNAEHKEIFCDQRLEGAKVCIFGATVRGVMLNTMGSLSAAARVYGKGCLKRIKIFGAMRKYWRESALRKKSRNGQRF